MKRITKPSTRLKMINIQLMLLIVIIGFSALFLSGCDLTYLGFPDQAKGALTVSINASRLATNRSIVPVNSMEPAEYKISGSGPAGAVFETTTIGGVCSVYDLAIGQWKISVSAFNSEKELIGFGEDIVIITASQTTESSVVVESCIGTGSLTLTASWLEEEVSNPEISATLTDYAGQIIDLPFTVSAGTANYSDAEIATGYYTLNIQLLENGAVLSGLVETVRIIENFQTKGDFNFSDINNPTGDVSIAVTVELQDPLEPEITGAVATIAYGTNMTVNAAVPGFDNSTLIFKWYVNGTLAGTETSLSFGNELRWGSYRLDLVVSTVDGSQSGSSAHYFTVE